MISELLVRARVDREGEGPKALSLGNLAQMFHEDRASGRTADATRDLDLYAEMSAARPSYLIRLEQLTEALINDILDGNCSVRLDSLQTLLPEGCQRFEVTPRSHKGDLEDCVFYCVVDSNSKICRVYVDPNKSDALLLDMPEREEDVAYSHAHPVHLLDLPDPDSVLAQRIEELAKKAASSE